MAATVLASPASLHIETAEACTSTSWAANSTVLVLFSQHLQEWLVSRALWMAQHFLQSTIHAPVLYLSNLSNQA